MFRFIIGVIVSIFMISLLRMIMSAITREIGPNKQQQQASSTGGGSAGSPRGGELRKCPSCSTYHTVSNIAGRTKSGEVVHFCSTDCREKYSVSASAATTSTR